MFATRVLSAAALFVSLAAALSLDAPTEWKQCERIQLVGKGKGSLNLAILHEDDECGDAVKEWLNVESATFNYTVPSTLPVGQKVVVLLEENGSEAEEWSQPITVVAGNCDGAAVPPADDNTDNFAGGSPSGSGTTVVTPSPSSTSTSGSGNGGAANVGSAPGSKSDTDDDKNGAARAGVSVAFVVGAAVLAMAF